jgi:hypothetical protein
MKLNRFVMVMLGVTVGTALLARWVRRREASVPYAGSGGNNSYPTLDWIELK